MAEQRGPASAHSRNLLNVNLGGRSRSSSIVWIDMLTKIAPTTDDERKVSIPVYDDDDEERQQGTTIDDEIFNYFAGDSEYILAGRFLAMLENTGLRRTDPRLEELFTNLKTVLKEEEVAHRGRLNDDFVGSIETLHLSRETFKEVIMPNIIMISAAFRQQFIIPKFDQFCQNIEDIFMECKDITSGSTPPYLDQLKNVDPNFWGLSICTIDGQRYSIGDATVSSTFHSISKPLMYAIALSEIGKDVVHKYVGQEPSGYNYNELALDGSGRPHNPMINSGSIMIHALLQAFAGPKMNMSKRFDWTQKFFKKLGGEEYVGFNNGMFLEKRQASDRNWALAHFMKEYNCFPPGTELADCIEYYLQTSSLESNCEVMSVVASTLANGGVCPTTGEKVLNGDVVADVLSVMFSCGMFDFSGKFAFKVGLPAKSSISGMILLVVPNVLGMALWSPCLDKFKNSSRGVAFCEKLVDLYNFHMFENSKFTNDKEDPIRKNVETKGSATVSLLFSAGAGDLNSIIRHHLCGVDMGSSDFDDRTALHISASGGHYEVVEYLLRQCNLNPLRKDRWGKTPYDNALSFNHDKVAELLNSWRYVKKNGSHAPSPES
ncbi:Glutaminase liver isoform, mitochondrial [Orchesella cincta]|uniref:glutaminase n=1 Tax=Orchesella cincta TaxID=48709 RepID=A0A1D2MWU5_ORCCI|nr:Glutaminase liver isoform, mitochondrial [Orchesella cincta]